jgi:hypothetical protein
VLLHSHNQVKIPGEGKPVLQTTVESPSSPCTLAYVVIMHFPCAPYHTMITSSWCTMYRTTVLTVQYNPHPDKCRFLALPHSTAGAVNAQHIFPFLSMEAVGERSRHTLQEWMYCTAPNSVFCSACICDREDLILYHGNGNHPTAYSSRARSLRMQDWRGE